MKLIAGINPGTPLQFTFNGQELEGFAGEMVASALLRAGLMPQRVSIKRADPRGYYCGMGICWECAVLVPGDGVVRSCSYPLCAGLAVLTADGALP